MSENKHQRRDDQRAGVRLDWEDTPPAGTTQQVKHGDVPSLEITLRQAEALVEVFGGHDALVSVIERPEAWSNMDPGLYAYFSEYPEEGSLYLGPTDVDDDLAMNGRAPAAPVRTWRERLGLHADFPLHVPSNVEWAMEAEIAELRASRPAPPASADPFGTEQQAQWFERLCAARVAEQPVPGAVTIWRCDLVSAVAELLQLRAYREHHLAKEADAQKRADATDSEGGHHD